MKEIIIKRFLAKECGVPVDSVIETLVEITDPSQWISLMDKYAQEMCEIQKILCESKHSSENACKTLLQLFSPDDLRKPEGKYHIGEGILLSKEQFIDVQNKLDITDRDEICRLLYANYLPNMIKEQRYYG